ncbi:probable serine/threonine-protein kinase fhkE [Tetranychus urticae]|uniref:Uncharacterized protein n=1 Tax=Tetranychus urticae TaxID=32264 RepID=T1KCG4_TETUR|nr:probable serine/threonine-protein kinase fhkE [Tetranychus urticae]
MAEGDRPSSSAGNRRRTGLKQSLSVDNACIFEMEGLDFEGDFNNFNSASKSSHRTRDDNELTSDSSGRNGDNNDNNNNRKRNNVEYNDTDEDEEDKNNEDDDDEDNCDQRDVRNMFDRMSLDSKCTRQFATSLPIQVPIWKTSPLVQESDDGDDEQNINFDKDPMKIAESLRALAWSVKDGTEMFGDLPRHRLKPRPI